MLLTVKIKDLPHPQLYRSKSESKRHSFTPSNPKSNDTSPDIKERLRRSLSAEVPWLRMAFSFSNSAAGSTFGLQQQTNGTAQVTEGPELKEISTNELGFLPLAGETKLQLLPTPWPSDSLPPPPASLLGVASSKGLLAAAGPDVLVLAGTDAVREAFRAEGSAALKTFEPQLKITVPKLSHVAFSADENVLVVSAIDGGGLAVYEVAGLMNGKTEPSMQIATNNTPLRALIPNPNPDHAEQFAVVTTEGDLLLANLKRGQLESGSNGPVMRSGVSCISWSNKGKQIVAGLADGSAVQLKPTGEIAAEIPRPPALGANMHVSSISWLENDIFFMIYSPSSVDDGSMVDSDFYILSRQKGTTNFTFQRSPPVCSAFGLDRQPASQMITRLRNFPPHIQYLLVVASTNSTDLGIVTKSAQALSTENVVGEFTFTTLADDSRRAELPMVAGLDTSPIGLSLDLSSREKVDNPILGDSEILQSDTPLPDLLLLNNAGVLSSWWVIYSASIREKQLYPDMVIAGPNQASTPSSAQPATSHVGSGFGQPSFGTSSASPAPGFGRPTFGSPVTTTPAAPAFGQSAFASSAAPSFGRTTSGTVSAPTSGPSGGPAFGAASTPGTGTVGFGQPSAMGGAKPSWASAGSEQPTFGSASPLGSKPPFGAGASNAPSFGQAGFASNQQTTSLFGGASDSTKSGFSSFANAGGFGAAKSSGESPFSKPAADNSWSKPSDDNSFGKPASSSIFGQNQQTTSFGSNMDVSSSFGTPETKPSTGLLGAGVGGFKLGSSFKGDGTASDDLPKPQMGSTDSLFSSGFGNMLGESTKEATPAQDKEEEMDDDAEQASRPTEQKAAIAQPAESAEPAKEEKSFVTPPSTIIHSKATPAPPLSNLFGTQSQPNTTPAEVQKSKPFSFSGLASTTPTAPPKSMPFQAQSTNSTTPKIKTEPPSEGNSPGLDNIPQAPLPPDSISKVSYTVGDTSVSSIGSRESKESVDDAPLPPDFIAAKPKNSEATNAALPDEGSDLSSEFAGSEGGLSEGGTPTEVPADDEADEDAEEEQTTDFKESPESSFSKVEERSPTGGLFTKITPISPQPLSTNRPLFGEIQSVFPPPKLQESPRSPSPVRKFPNDLLRPEVARSASAPIRPGSAIAAKRAELSKSQFGLPQPVAQESQKIQQEKQASSHSRTPVQEPQLDDDENERLRAELDRPVSPSEELDSFLYHQDSSQPLAKSGMAGQIERLYQDINSMVDTLGLNARALSAFMLYQQNPPQRNEFWPEVLQSENPDEAHDEDWLLVDIERLDEGYDMLGEMLQEAEITDVAGKVQKCRNLLSKDMFQLRSKLISLRKALHAKENPNASVINNLSSEQASIQHDLRKSSTLLQSKLAEAEQGLTVLRAKLAEVPQRSSNHLQKKPTVEAVTATINKMTMMAEQKSADIDLLEAHLNKLNMAPNGMNGSVNGSRQGSVEPEFQPRTPRRSGSALRESISYRTPASGSNSVYHTPDSKFAASIRSTPGRFRNSLRESINEDTLTVSPEEAERWQQKARRKKEVQEALKEALKTRRTKKQA